MKSNFYKAKRVDNNELIQGNLLNLRCRHFVVSPFDNPEEPVNLICVFADSIEVIRQDKEEKHTGIELIAIERSEQIEKHVRTIQYDSVVNKYQQLARVARIIIAHESERTNPNTPDGWDRELFQKILRKSYKHRLIIAGALIAAEIDRIQHSEK